MRNLYQISQYNIRNPYHIPEDVAAAVSYVVGENPVHALGLFIEVHPFAGTDRTVPRYHIVQVDAELLGDFTPADRKKMLDVKRCNPHFDIRFV